MTGWGREGDSGFIAIDDLQPVGAAWYRLFPRREPGFGFVDERTPELTVAVVPSRRGKGIGHELMEALLAQARREDYDALSLSAPRGATALYERYGFRTVGDDGEAVTMRVAL